MGDLVKFSLALVVVNLITFTRIIGTFIMPIVSNSFSINALLIYLAILFFTDCIDGILARRYKVSSIFGAMLDAIADKLFGIAYLYLIAIVYPVLFLPIVVECLIIVINLYGIINGALLESSKLGKMKTWVFGVLTVFAFFVGYINELSWFNRFNLSFKYSNIIIFVFSIIMFIVDLFVAFNYFIKVKREVKVAKENNIMKKNYKLKKGKDLVYALFNYDYYINTLSEPLLVRLGDVVDERED